VSLWSDVNPSQKKGAGLCGCNQSHLMRIRGGEESDNYLSGKVGDGLEHERPAFGQRERLDSA